MGDARGTDSQRVQDVDGPAHIQGLAHPAWHSRSRMDIEALDVVPCQEDSDWVDGYFRERWGFG